MAICLDGEQRRECVAFRPRVDLTAGIPSRDGAADAVRAFEPVPRQRIASLHDVAAQFKLVRVARSTQVQFDNMAGSLGRVGCCTGPVV